MWYGSIGAETLTPQVAECEVCNMRKTASLFITCLFASLPLMSHPFALAASPATPATLLISELQTGGCKVSDVTVCTEDGKMEFIELYNPKSTAQLLQGWNVQYASASGKNTTTLATLNGTLDANGYLLLAHAGYYSGADVLFGATDTKSSGMLAKTGGSVQIVNGSGTVIDLIGWGSSTTRVETIAARAPNPGQSLQRKTSNGTMDDTGNNAQDFIVASTSTPQGNGYTSTTPDPSGEIPPAAGSGPTTSGLTCEGVLISELLSNPTGTDTGHEFIELYNPTDDVIPLDGCSLQTTGNKKAYDLTGNILETHTYRAFYSDKTGLTLPNASGGSVWLLSRTDELQNIAYPGTIASDVAWARFGNTWQETYKPTPGTANTLTAQAACPAGQYRSSETGRCRNSGSAASALKSCRANQERNPATNRCRTIVDILGLQQCKPGQYRNPETNRCRSTTTDSSSLQPCKAGQERNPATNRCRKVLGASTTLKPCATGQTRNPLTNRCRKDLGTSPATVSDVQTVASTTAPVPWIIAALAVVGALSYGAYEWRQELASSAARLRTWLTARVPAFRHR